MHACDCDLAGYSLLAAHACVEGWVWQWQRMCVGMGVAVAASHVKLSQGGCLAPVEGGRGSLCDATALVVGAHQQPEICYSGCIVPLLSISSTYRTARFAPALAPSQARARARRCRPGAAGGGRCWTSPRCQTWIPSHKRWEGAREGKCCNCLGYKRQQRAWLLAYSAPAVLPAPLPPCSSVGCAYVLWPATQPTS